MQDKNSFTENEIRPDDLMKQQELCLQEDIAYLKSLKHLFVQVSCPACGKNDSKFQFEKNEVSFCLCNACETLFANPRPSQEAIDSYYKNSKNYEFWNTHIFPASETARREKIFKPRVNALLETIQKFHLQTDTLIEIGSGFGTFCEELKKTNTFNKIISVEPTPSLADTCRKKGLNVISQPVEQIDETTLKADIIVSFEVIEHLFNPSIFLSKCQKLLKPKGMIFLTCPNYFGFDVQILGATSSAIDNEHINLFHPNSIRTLLERCGFRVLEISTPGKLDAELVRKAVLSGKHSKPLSPFLQKILIEEWDTHGALFQEFLRSQKLSSNMQILAQKVS